MATEADHGTAAPQWTGGQQVGAAVGSSPWGAVEIIALLLLTLGAVFLPFVGPVLGLVFVWASTQWTRRAKLIATVIVAVLLLVPIVGLLAVRVGVG